MMKETTNPWLLFRRTCMFIFLLEFAFLLGFTLGIKYESRQKLLTPIRGLGDTENSELPHKVEN